ncbi:alpha-L-fucosidase-domain-containing protein [Naematelia encephala]|uniref:alpha-L-fucosidase n=1 Tax=Naematelia encephala TaxID=71784 RepID=A0A1Y2APK2_9TREE|nr:alpha-L-fucosidase-domain-containing protein [Naematelia encephala]
MIVSSPCSTTGMRPAILSWAVLALAASTGAQQAAFDATRGPKSIALNLSSHFNNKGTSVTGENDGVGFVNGTTFPSEFLPKGSWHHDGVDFEFPGDWAGLRQDNIRTDSQTLHLEQPAEIATVHLVAAGESPGGFLLGETTEDLILGFTDGSTDKIELEVKNWWAIHWTNKGPIRAPYHFEADASRNYNATHMFHIALPMPYTSAGRSLSTITLPGPNPRNALHIFAVTVIPVHVNVPAVVTEESKIHINNVKATRRWEDVNGVRGQVVEVEVINPYSVTKHHDTSYWVTHPVQIQLSAPGVSTLRPGRLARLMPGDQVTIEVLVRPSSVTATFAGAQLVFAGEEKWISEGFSIEGSSLIHDWTQWTEDTDDLEQHSAPSWFSGAKFGIFIHWGLFSVPAWTDMNKYAEWYNFWLHDEGQEGGTYKYHLEKYGPDFVYDDFIPQFTASKFNATEWVDLFAEAGARYFVLTTKHHDGFALFDTEDTSDRNSVKLGPKRDLLQELMDAADKRPEVKKGTYFSMPEWYNPLYQKYAKVLFPGGPATNPYTGELEPYTGFVDVDDYVEDIQLAQMKILAKRYKTDMMWCDIGLANHSSAFAAEWYAETAKEGRQVAIDNRCGIGGDFDTPEMTKFATAQSRKWETCAGMDPHSFGYNAETKPEEYRNATDIIHSLVDITAKGGNFLLNVGPTGEGEIIEAMAKPLLEAGKWLKSNGRAIYDTVSCCTRRGYGNVLSDVQQVPFTLVPEVITPELNVQFTRTETALYIISLKKPSGRLTIPAPLPVLEGDHVNLIGAQSGQKLDWEWEDGSLIIHVPEGAVEEAGLGIAWVFEVIYQRVNEMTKKWSDEL